MKNTSSENRRKMSSKNSKFVRQMKRLSRSQFIAFLVFQKFLRNTVSAFSNRSDQFYRKKPLGEILLKLKLKIDGDVMVIFEPAEYMEMFFQSVTQVARKEKVLPIRVEPITFWLLESRICTNNQKVAYVQTPHPSPQEKSENAVNQSKILLRFFLRRGEVCTQATRRSLGLSPIGSTQIFSSKLPVSLTKKQTSSSL